MRMCSVCLSRLQPLRPTNAATNTLASGSAHFQPNAIMSTAAAIAPTEPTRSLKTCRYAPRMLTLASVSLFFSM